ncbi:MAG: hypothetical protein ACD_61C00246G0008, partial [uncultured bacterium]
GGRSADAAALAGWPQPVMSTDNTIKKNSDFFMLASFGAVCQGTITRCPIIAH